MKLLWHHLSSCHTMTIVAVVIQYYEVLYEFIDKSCTGKDYVQFLLKVTHFIRKYICNKDTEIVIFEDNYPIHGIDEVENTIQKLKIAVLPTVPCINEVVEGYFGLTKTNNIMTAGNSGEIFIRSDTEENWKFSTDENVKNGNM